MTIKQMQCLLCYLGYYNGEIDGIWGRGSESATRQFQTDYDLVPDGSFGPATEARIKEVIANDEAPADFWAEIKYFKREEFRCKCGGKHCDGFPAEMDKTLIRTADRVREHFGKRMIVSSGVRCETHNANVGGVPGSRHKLGKAMDFCVDGFSAASVLDYVQKLPEVRYSYAIDSNYVHMDVV